MMATRQLTKGKRKNKPSEKFEAMSKEAFDSLVANKLVDNGKAREAKEKEFKYHTYEIDGDN